VPSLSPSSAAAEARWKPSVGRQAGSGGSERAVGERGGGGADPGCSLLAGCSDRVSGARPLGVLRHRLAPTAVLNASILATPRRSHHAISTARTRPPPRLYIAASLPRCVLASLRRYLAASVAKPTSYARIPSGRARLQLHGRGHRAPSLLNPGELMQNIIRTGRAASPLRVHIHQFLSALPVSPSDSSLMDRRC
jgi:hypothetical protein